MRSQQPFAMFAIALFAAGVASPTLLGEKMSRADASSDGTGAMSPALFGTALSNIGQARQSPNSSRTTAPKANQANDIDSKTGCHPGHDERAHPGGCHQPRQ